MIIPYSQEFASTVGMLDYGDILVLDMILTNYLNHRRKYFSPRGFIKVPFVSFSIYEKSLLLISRANHLSYAEIEELFSYNEWCLPRSQQSLRDFFNRAIANTPVAKLVDEIKQAVSYDGYSEKDSIEANEAIDDILIRLAMSY